MSFRLTTSATLRDYSQRKKRILAPRLALKHGTALSYDPKHQNTENAKMRKCENAKMRLVMYIDFGEF
jgi:hypothetical protein